MKNKVLFPAIVLLGLVLSCSEEANISKQNIDNNYALNNVGLLHNEAVDYYYNYRNSYKSFAEYPDDMSEIISVICNFLIEEGFESNQVFATKQQINTMLDSSALKSLDKNTFSLDQEGISHQLKTQNLFSESFTAYINEAISMSAEDNSAQKIKNWIDNDFSKLEFNSSNDHMGKQIFISIFNSSFEYWSSHGEGSSLKSVQMEPESWVVLNDAIGGILGSAFGPIGSIILGSAFSIGTVEEQ